MRRTLNCGKCSTTTFLPVGYNLADGDVLMCGGCGARYTVHLCNHDHGMSGLQSVVQAELLEVLVS
jgi:ribosomal protein S27AE